jgi:hypothetical protein
MTTKFVATDGWACERWVENSRAAAIPCRLLANLSPSAATIVIPAAAARPSPRKVNASARLIR